MSERDDRIATYQLAQRMLDVNGLQLWARRMVRDSLPLCDEAAEKEDRD